MGRFDHLVEKYKDKTLKELKDLHQVLEDKWEADKGRIEEIEPPLKWEDYRKLVFDTDLYWEMMFTTYMIQHKIPKSECNAYDDVVKDGLYPDDMYTIGDFKEMCKVGAFTSYDGFGEYSDGEKKYDLHASPLAFVYDLINPEFTHVVWYNK